MRILQKHAQSTHYIEHVLSDALSHHSLQSPDRALVHELTCGVVRWQSTLDWLIRQKTSGREQKLILQILLRLGLYQLFWLDRIPKHAAVHETVALAKQLGFGPQAGFVNAVLRAYIREEGTTRQWLEECQTKMPALGFSHPEWLVEKWHRQFTPTAAAQLMSWNNTPPKTFARIHTLQADPVHLLEQWRVAESVDYDLVHADWFPDHLVFLLKSHPPIESLPSFRTGQFYVQDPSTLLAVHLLQPQPGDAVLDLCAAPGGKTTYIAQCMRDQGCIVAQDVTPDRLDSLRANCERLRLTSIEIARAPEHLVPGLTREFDRVLVDAPCSNTGVMRRRIDTRWRLRPEDVANLPQQQVQLLERAAIQVKTGGTLVYSTCSLEPEENEAVVQTFLQQHPTFALEESRTLRPWTDAVDGAYAARLIRQRAS